MRVAWAANESQFYSSKFGQSRLNRFYQPKAQYKNRPDSKLGSVRLEIAARLKARFSARAGHCRSGLGSPRLGLTRLGSARLATRGSTHLRSWFRLSFGLRIWTGESTRCSTRLNSEFGSGSARSFIIIIIIYSYVIRKTTAFHDKCQHTYNTFGHITKHS